MFAKQNKVKQPLFSNNLDGACPECKDLGVISTDRAFFDAVEVRCEHCDGSGFKPEILKDKSEDKTITNVMAMAVKQGLFLMNRI